MRLPIGGRSLSMVVPDERAWLRDGTGAAGPPPRRGAGAWEPPYWMRVWPAAIGLARALVRSGRLAGVRVLDLGCGLGVPGCQAAALGADVTFVDRESDALAFARWNAAAQAGAGRIEATELDWSSATVAAPFDLVLLSDVSYHPMHHRALERQLAVALAPGGVALHSDPCRPAATTFLDGLTTGYSVAQVRCQQAVAGERVEVRLSLLSRTGESAQLATRLQAALLALAESRAPSAEPRRAR
ncbi:MAG: methyltransferase domain-containing protein [Planctomycetes bacterium]|nr:methyltransferase domain-containing protein [Planctomycetota bacterium]